MGTINSVGTLYYDWNHLEDGTAHATKWFVVIFFPVWPMQREHLEVIEAGESPSFFSLTGNGTWKMDYRVLGSIPMERRGICRTLIKTYVLLPLVLLIPTVCIVLVSYLLLLPREINVHDMSDRESVVLFGMMGSILIYWGVVVSTILDRARGRRRLKKTTG